MPYRRKERFSMKKIVSVLLIMVMCLCLCSCGDKGENEVSSGIDSVKETKNNVDIMSLDDGVTLESLKEMVKTDTDETVASLYSEWETLKTNINTYDDYEKSATTVEDFYEKIVEENRLLCIRLREYCYLYAKLVLDSGMSFDDMYDELEEIHDEIYEDAGDTVHDEIYDGILDDMKEYYYDGILDDAKDDVEYSDWYDIRSDEYEWWYDARSDVYEDYYDFRSDSYDFYYDMRGDIYSEEIDEAKETMNDFKEDIIDLKD